MGKAKKTPKTEFVPLNIVKDAKSRRQAAQSFYTPMGLVEKLVGWASVYEEALCLEPSAGDGRIVYALKEAGVKNVHACELDESLHERIEAAGGTVKAKDFLIYKPGGLSPFKGYNRIVMNPPFNRDAYKTHIEKAYALLAKDGMLISLAPKTVLDSLATLKLHLPECNYATFEPLDGKLFKEYGTAIQVGVVEIHKPKDGNQHFEGYCNRATFDACMLVLNDRPLLEAWRERKDWQGSEYKDLVRKTSFELLRNNCSAYGVNWHEVSKESKPR